MDLYWCYSCGERAIRTSSSMDPNRPIGDCTSGVKAHSHQLITPDFEEAVRSVVARASLHAEERVRERERVVRSQHSG